ncbi:TraR/DksA family transcriptional regulator [Aquisphaera insulae]|uniref:TraR/DksA family transcriptional regulator n=1 Tax=Aquisphaera insulae TaxID=2712864 RepID=UPI0013E9B802|nr:TraR/DksA family transcriptional regulator [Aquisphaera insulae]
MTAAEIDHFRRRLLAMRRRLGADVSELADEALRPVGGEASGNLSDVPIHLADLASGSDEEEITLDLMENEGRIMSEIDDALERIEQGTFGRCENCHEEIPRERLEAVPYTRYCIRCARELQAEADR